MTYNDNALAGLDAYFGQILASLSPARRRRAAMKLGQALRRANVERIAANEQPDGTSMEPRKPRKDRRGRLRKQVGGKMFRKLRQARKWRIDAQPDSVEIIATGNQRIAAQHQFGEEGQVGRAPDGRQIRHRYPVRRLLGFAPGDEREALRVAEEMLGLAD